MIADKAIERPHYAAVWNCTVPGITTFRMTVKPRHYDVPCSFEPFLDSQLIGEQFFTNNNYYIIAVIVKKATYISGN